MVGFLLLSSVPKVGFSPFHLPSALPTTLRIRRSTFSTHGGVCRLDRDQVRSPDLIDLEYADLNLKEKVAETVGHVRIRQHVNPLNSSLMVPVQAPNWKEVFDDPTLPLMVDIGSAGRTCSFLGERIGSKEHVSHFMFANATVSFEQLVSTYTGPLMLVSILCPDPHFKKKHHKRRVVQKPLVDSILKNLAPRGKVFMQSDVLDVALDMRNQFDSQADVLQHIDDLDPNVLCDPQGWLLRNPMGIRTEREIHAELEGAKIYRRLYQKRELSC